jgi:hypothetical protein
VVKLPDGIGEQAIRVPLAKLRDIGMLPLDVEIVRILPEPRPFIHEAWFVGSPRHDVYLHVRGRTCFRTFEGAHMAVEDLDAFLTRHWQLAGLTDEA